MYFLYYFILSFLYIFSQVLFVYNIDLGNCCLVFVLYFYVHFRILYMKKILNVLLFPSGHSLLDFSKLLVYINENFKVVIIQINMWKRGNFIINVKFIRVFNTWIIFKYCSKIFNFVIFLLNIIQSKNVRHTETWP